MDPESWVDLYGDYLFGYALSRIGDPSIAEDLVQETFLAGLRAQEGFEGRSSVRTWLVAILKNKIVDSLRKMSREKPVEDVEAWGGLEEEFFHENGEWRLKPAEWEVNPSRLVERKEFWSGTCYAFIPPLERTRHPLHYSHRRPEKESKAPLQQSPGNPPEIANFSDRQFFPCKVFSKTATKFQEPEDVLWGEWVKQYPERKILK